VRSFIELHGGWVAMRAEAGKGVRVACHMPAIAPPVAASAQSKGGVHAA
jgi:signal transduction histidine kinase